MDIPYFFRSAPFESDGLGNYLVEVSAPQQGEATLTHAAQRARAAAEKVTTEGVPVRHLSSFVVPSDETSFHVFEGRSAAAVPRAAELADLHVERVVEALT